MRVTIVCENKHIEKVRETAKQISLDHLALRTALSPSGKEPATHWMCSCDMTGAGLEKVKELQKYSTISGSGPKTVLDELGLKPIK